MQKKLIVPAVLAMGFAGAALPVTAVAQSQGGSENQSSGNQSSGNQSSGNQGSGNQGSGNQGSGNQGSGNQGSGNAYERYLRQLHEQLVRDNSSGQGSSGASQSGDRRSGGPQYGSREHAREQFRRGYMAGRESERQGGGSQQSSSQRGQDMNLIPNVYSSRAPFQSYALVPDYSRSMDHLLIAAQSLREAIQDLAQQPASDRRNQAISDMHDALLETQQAMLRIPPDMR